MRSAAARPVAPQATQKWRLTRSIGSGGGVWRATSSSDVTTFAWGVPAVYRPIAFYSEGSVGPVRRPQRIPGGSDLVSRSPLSIEARWRWSHPATSPSSEDRCGPAVSRPGAGRSTAVILPSDIPCRCLK